MKSYLIFSITFMLMLMLSGCNPTSSTDDPTSVTTENPEIIAYKRDGSIQTGCLETDHPYTKPSSNPQHEYKVALLRECAVNMQTKYEIVIESYVEQENEHGMDIDIRYPAIISDEYPLIKIINDRLFSASYRNDEELLKKPENNINVFLEVDCEVIYSDNEIISVVYYGEYYRGLLYCCTIDLYTGEYTVAASSVTEYEFQQKVENEEYIIIMPFVEAIDSLELQQYVISHFSLEENEFYCDIRRFFEFYSYSLFLGGSFRTQNGVGLIVESRGFIGHSMILLFENLGTVL